MKKLILSFSILLVSSALSAQTNYIGGIDPGSKTGGTTSTSIACDTVFSFPTPDSWPAGLVSDGNNLWSAAYSGNLINKYSLSGALLGSIANPAAPFTIYPGGDLEFDGTNLLFFAEETDTLYKINPSTGAVVSHFRVAPCTGNCFGVAYDGSNIWISDYSPSNVIYKINPTTGALINSYPIAPPSALLPIKFMNGGLYGLSMSPPTLHQIDTSGGGILSGSVWCLGFPLGFSKSGGVTWGLSSQITSGGTQRIYQFAGTVGLQDNQAENELLTIFPNPSSEKITALLSSGFAVTNLEIVNSLGEKVYEDKSTFKTEKEIAFGKLPAGMYLLKLRSNDKQYVKKFVVQ